MTTSLPAAQNPEANSAKTTKHSPDLVLPETVKFLLVLGSLLMEASIFYVHSVIQTMEVNPTTSHVRTLRGEVTSKKPAESILSSELHNTAEATSIAPSATSSAAIQNNVPATVEVPHPAIGEWRVEPDGRSFPVARYVEQAARE